MDKPKVIPSGYGTWTVMKGNSYLGPGGKSEVPYIFNNIRDAYNVYKAAK